jgi:hypothetical protein
VTRWTQVPDLPGASRGPGSARLVAVLPFAVAGLLALAGRPVPAALVLTAATVLLALRRFAPNAAHRVDRWVAAFATGLAKAASAVLLGLVQVVVFAPLALLGAALHRDPLHALGHWRDRPVSRSAMARRTFGVEDVPVSSPSRGSRAARLLPRVIGWVAVVLVANYALGWLWDEYAGSHDDPASTFAAVDYVGEYRDLPAMADEPWADEYWAEFADLDYEFVPYLLSRVGDVDGDTISSADGVRHSFEAPGEATTDVWVLGGAAAWGQGQRDEHTIPSELARLADADGRPIRVRNLAQPGYTSWQSALLFEEQLAMRPAPDLVVVYDGADDVAVQVERPSESASHYNSADIARTLTGRESTSEEVDDLWEEYRETSVLTRLAEGIGGIFGIQPAAAAEDLEGRVRRLHGESLDLIGDLARAHDVDTLFVWQAASGVPRDGGAYRDLAASDTSAVDLSGVLDDHEDHYLDGVLTDEDGARIVAEALWPLAEERLG